MVISSMNLVIAVPGGWVRVSTRVELPLEQQEDRSGTNI